MKYRIYFLPIVFLFLLSACIPQAPDIRPDQLTFAPLVFNVPQVERLTLPNGIRLYLNEDHELPLVQVTAMVGAGSIGDPVDKSGLGGLFAAVLRTGGAGSYGPQELDETLETLAADLAVSTDTYATAMELSVQSADLEKGLALLADVLRHPRFDPSRLELARKQTIEGIRRQYDDPASIASRAVMKALYKGHPLGELPTVASVSAINREDLIDFHKRYFHPNNLYMAVSGDFDRNELGEILEKLFGDWLKSDFVPQEIPPVSEQFKPAVLVAQKEIPQTTVLIGDVGIDKLSPDQYAVRVMNFILGGGGFNSRLMREIRSDRGLAYSVYSYFDIGRRLPGPFLASCETKNESAIEVVNLIQGIMKEMRETPVTEQELQLAQESLINSFVFAFADSHDVVARTMRLDYYGYPERFLETYRENIAGVSAQDVLKVAQKYLLSERQVVVLVGDEKGFDAQLASLGKPVHVVPKED